MTPQKIHARSTSLLFMWRLTLLLAGLFGLLRAEPAQAAPLSCSAIYGMNTTGTIYEISATGSTTLAASVPHSSSGQEQANPFGIGVGGNVVYVATRSGIVTSYDMNTGASTVSAPPTYPSGEVMDNIPAGAVNPKNGWFYLARATINGGEATSWYLYAFNPATPAAAPIHIGLISGTIANNGDIVFDDNGNLYLLAGNVGTTGVNTRIYRIGQVPTSYAPSGFSATLLTQFSAADNFSGLAFNTAGELVASSAAGLLRRYNPTSGQKIGADIATGVTPLADMASCHGGNSIRLYKDIPVGRANAGDQFRLTLSGTPFPSVPSVDTTGSALGVQSAMLGPFPAVDGSVFTINEIALGSTDLSAYNRSWRCDDSAGAGRIIATGSSLPASVVVPVDPLSVSSDISCFIVNEMRRPPPEIGGSPVCTASGGTDVLFLLDNSGSIDDVEYAAFAASVLNVGQTLRAANPATRIGVAHYSGEVATLATSGQGVYFERDFSSAPLVAPIRRFGISGGLDAGADNLAGAVLQMSYGLDGDAGTTSSYILSSLTELSRDLLRPLQIVAFTDARRAIPMDSSIIDGPGYGYEPDDGSSFTIYNLLKDQGVKFSVMTLPSGDSSGDLARDAAAAAISSRGGFWSGSVEANSEDPEGSGTPRRFTTSPSFSVSAAQVLEFVTPIAGLCPAPMDYGDAPASYGAPSHVIAAGGPYLGANPPDAEAAPLHNADALGDDQNGVDDEDGVSFWGMEVGGTGVITTTISTSDADSTYLSAWIDWNRDGDFLDAGEQVATNFRDDGQNGDFALLDGEIHFPVSVPVWALENERYFARFRLSTQPDLAPDSGVAPDGEIEDHSFLVASPTPPPSMPEGSCFAPNMLGNGDFSTTANWAFSYPSSPVSGDVTIGLIVDNPAPLVGSPPLFSNGLGVGRVYVDNPGNLGGVTNLLLRNESLVSVVSGENYVFSFDISRFVNGANHDANLSWALIHPVTNAIVQTIPSSSITIPTAAGWNTHSVVFAATVPTGDYKIGMTFRPVSLGTGNVRDFYLDRAYFAPLATCDYGDAPASYGAPAHMMSAGGPYLGANPPDEDAGLLHSADATGDDLDGIDDEDGVSAFPPFIVGATSYSLPAANVVVAGTGTLHAWIDFDQNGVFTAAEHASVAATGGVLAGPLSWTGISIGAPGPSYVRLRIASATLADDPGTTALDERSTLPASDGEVEDYAVTFTTPMLPPDAGMALCTQPAPASMAETLAIMWGHNVPAGTFAADVVSDLIPTSEIAGAADLIPGAGLTYTRPSPDFTAYYVGQADLSGAAAAFVAQDRIDYSFTTSSRLQPGRYLRNFMLHRASGSYPTSFPFRTTILLSTDPNFSTAMILANSWQLLQDPANDYPLRAADAPVLLAPSTTYHVRALIHDVGASSGQAFWDDFSIFLGSCADLSDAPASYGEASHAGDGSMRLGALRSVDPGPIANADATGDGATDDGVFLGDAAGGVSLQGATLVQGEPQILEFAVTGAGRLSGWLDANRDGIFSLGAETLFLNLLDNGPDDENPATGVIRVTITPPALTGGVSFARFRWSSAPQLGPVGPAADGEVEDYALLLVARSEADFLLTPDHESTVEAGQLAIYPHRLLVGPGLNGGALSFAVESERGLEWSLLRDDGDGVYGAGDFPWVQGAPIPAGDHAFWLLVKTPQEAPGGWSDLTRLTATILSGATSKSALVQDLTRIGGEGSGSVFARKLQALDANCDGAPDLGEAGFTEQTLPIAQGGCVVYRIRFENRSVDPIRQVRIQDHTPSWMVYLDGSAQVRPPSPAGLTLLLLDAPAAAAAGPVSFSFTGILQPGEGGEVQFAARLGPADSASGGGGDPSDGSGDGN